MTRATGPCDEGRGDVLEEVEGRGFPLAAGVWFGWPSGVVRVRGSVVHKIAPLRARGVEKSVIQAREGGGWCSPRGSKRGGRGAAEKVYLLHGRTPDGSRMDGPHYVLRGV